MANRRMFSKSITSSSQFLMMPLTAQALYFHLGMNADDDGFVEHFAIMRMVEAKPDDLRVLASKSLVKVFDDKVLVISDWKENNYLRNDRYTPSKYLEIYRSELAEMSSGTPVVYQMDTQVRLGKVRKEKPTAFAGEISNPEEEKAVGEVIKAFEPFTPEARKFYARPPQREAARALVRDPKIGLSRVKVAMATLYKHREDQFAPLVDSPLELSRKWAKVHRYVKPRLSNIDD